MTTLLAPYQQESGLMGGVVRTTVAPAVIVAAARVLARELALECESVIAVQTKGHIELSYFLVNDANEPSGLQAVLRTELRLVGRKRWLQVSSLIPIWPMVAPYESELGELFGIRFTRESANEKESHLTVGIVLAPEMADHPQFPLRKGCVVGVGNTA